MNIKHAIAAASLVLGAVAISPSLASADTVGTPGEPNCFGMRVSHGSSDHDLTPRERAEMLQFVVYESGMISPDEVAAFEETFGVKDQTVTVRVFARFVRANCSDDPFVPTP
jgi:hypothetical protein